MKDMGVCKVGPTHCTESEAETLFRKAYGVNFLRIMSGQIVEV
jgi:metal-dependent hydrolase (beta-lactamase superfamily II)